jgi:hypothetical protein
MENVNSYLFISKTDKKNPRIVVPLQQKFEYSLKIINTYCSQKQVSHETCCLIDVYT